MLRLQKMKLLTSTIRSNDTKGFWSSRSLRSERRRKWLKIDKPKKICFKKDGSEKK